MGILNVTPDSFSDGGRWLDPDAATSHALTMIDQGADLIDVGGESTRPGADAVDAEEEVRRVVPVIERIVDARPDIPISIDTSKAPVARAAVDAGAAIVNDISGLGFDPDMPGTVAELDVPVVLMHIRGTPQTMQDAPRYDDVIDEVKAFLAERIELATAAGVSEEDIVVDPGIGFGKTVEHNLEILRRLDELRDLGRPILIGTSRKSFIGKLTGRTRPVDREFGTAATHALAIAAGADILRAHDVRAAIDVARVSDALVRPILARD